MQPEQTVGGRLAEINQSYLDRDFEPKTAVEVDAILTELTDLASEVQSEPAADQPATVARLAEVQKLCTAWYNNVNAAGNTQAQPASLDRTSAQ